MISFNDIPYDILKNIYDFVYIDNSPIYNYRIRYVNNNFKNIVDNYNIKIPKNIPDNIVDKLQLFKYGKIKTLEWFLHKKYNIVYSDISTMIIYDRLDMLNLLLDYERYKNILFNRFYLTDCNISEDLNIFNIGKINRSYLLLACECDNLNIVKFLLESDNRHIYYLQINAAIEYCLKNKNLKIIEYLYNNYKYKIKDKNIDYIKNLNLN